MTKGLGINPSCTTDISFDDYLELLLYLILFIFIEDVRFNVFLLFICEFSFGITSFGKLEPLYEFNSVIYFGLLMYALALFVKVWAKSGNFWLLLGWEGYLGITFGSLRCIPSVSLYDE